MKIKKKILYIIAFLLFFICIGTNQSKAGNLKLNNLDFQAQINADGSMDVTETWDINIKSTNTLYKTFKTDNSKYSGITNATVTDITNGIQNNFIQTSEWAYHVAKGYYYGTENDDDDFEIGWGVGLDNSSARREYKISYTVKDAITKYNDYAELYWQFVGSTFEVDANKITGTILLPSNVDNKDEIKVWGHTKNLNGTIYATDTNKIEFEVDNFKNGTYVEVRTLFPTSLITTTGRIKNQDALDNVVQEETKWANKANASRKRQEWMDKNFKYVLFGAWLGLNILLGVFFFKKTIKYWKKIKGLNKFEPTTKLEYYRDLPDEDSTPGEAYKTMNENVTKFTAQNFGKIFSATVLDLTLRGYIEIQQEKKTLGKDIVTITEENIAEVISSWTGIPAKKITEDENEKLKNLEVELHKRVIGQNEAVEAVSKAIRRGRVGLKDPKRPIGSFLFLGPTGVGKTELSKALAEVLFGDENAMIRIDMSEYMEPHSVAKLIGAPPGYVGFDEGGQLTEKIRRKPYSVILFDEIEKAHPDVLNMLLQILDDGRITDSQGRTVNFKNTVIIMTSNLGARLITDKKHLGFSSNGLAENKDNSDEKTMQKEYEETKKEVMAELKKELRPEFINRIDEIIVFHKLGDIEIEKIIDIMLKEVENRLKEQKYDVEFGPEVKKLIAEKGIDQNFGARPLRRTIQNLVEDSLAEEILDGKLTKGKATKFTVKNGKIVQMGQK